MGKKHGPDSGGGEEELSAERERILMQGGKKKKEQPAKSFADFFKKEHEEPKLVASPAAEPLLPNPEPLLELPKEQAIINESKIEQASAQPEAEKTARKKLPPISPNSRLYRQFSKVFAENKYGEQDNFGSLENYLVQTLKDIKNGNEPLPPGCENPADLLKPYWETEKVAGIPVASLFALEHGLEFHENKQLREQYDEKFGRYLQNLLRPLSNPGAGPNTVGFPEDAQNLQDALRPLSETEVKAWFNNRKRDLEKQYKESGHPHYKKLAYKTYIRLGYDDYKKEFFPDPTPAGVKPTASDKDSQTNFGLDEPSDNDYYAYNQRKVEKKNAPISQTVKVERISQEVLGKSHEAVEPSEKLLDQFYGEAGNKKFEVEAGEVLPIRKAEFALLGNQLHIKFDRRMEKDGSFTYVPGGRVHVNLPLEIYTNFTLYKAEAEEALRNLVVENKGKWKPEVTNKITDISVGLGDLSHVRGIFNIPPALLRRLSPDLYGKYSDYLDSKSKASKKGLTEEDRKRIKSSREYAKDYESRLRDVPVKNLITNQETTITQYVWDKAFYEALEAKLGAEKLAELKKLALSSQPKVTPPVEAKAVPEPQPQPKIEPKVAEKTKELPKADMAGFMKELEDKYGNNFIEFLRKTDEVRDTIREKFHLKSKDAFLAIAQKGLSAENLKRFDNLIDLPEQQIVQEFFKGDSYYDNRSKLDLLYRALIKLLKENVPASQPKPVEKTQPVPSAGTPTGKGGGPHSVSPEPGKFRREPKTENKVEDKQIWPNAEYYPSFQVVQKIMDKYGRLDVPSLEQQINEFVHTDEGQKYFSRVTNFNETLSKQILEQALDAMGFLKDYQAGLIEYKNSPDYQQKLVERVRKEQEEWLRKGRIVEESVLFQQVQREMDFELLTKAVESFYHIRPETLKFEAEKLNVPENFEEIKYFFQPQCVIMRDTVSGFEYFGIPGPRGTWERVPLPENINIDNPEDIQTMHNILSDMVKDNSRPGKTLQTNFHPTIQLKGADGENFRDGRFEIYIDRTLVKTVPVRDFVDRNLVRGDVRNLDRNNEIYKELLVKSFDKLQHNQSASFAQRDTRMEALEDLLLNTPIQDNVSFGDEAKFIALKRRLAASRLQRVKGSYAIRQQGDGFVIIDKTNNRAA